jgi:hypothetical protein
MTEIKSPAAQKKSDRCRNTLVMSFTLAAWLSLPWLGRAYNRAVNGAVNHRSIAVPRTNATSKNIR